MTTLGDIIYGGAAGAAARLPGNTAAAREFLVSQGTGSAAQAPAYSAIQPGDLPGPSDWLNVKTQYDAKGDGRTVTDAAITASSAALTSNSAGFTSADAGKAVLVAGAGVVQPPAAPALATATTGGTVAAGTYKAEISYVNANGETTASPSATITTSGSTSTITVTSPAPSQGCTGWYAYVTQAGGSTYYRQQSPGSPTATGTNLVLTAPPATSGANPPGSNTATGAPLSTTISAYVSSTHVTLAAAAASTVTGATAIYGTDNTTAIQNATAAANTAGGGVVYFPVAAGQYCITAALTWYSNVTFAGGGAGTQYDTPPVVIQQMSTTADGIDGYYLNRPVIRDIAITGPGSGSGIGINLTTGGDTLYLRAENVLVQNFGGHGLYVQSPILSSLTTVISSGNGGDGLHIAGGTSTVFDACWGASNGGCGWYVSNVTYMTWNGCAADANENGWYLGACESCAINGSGAEINTVDGLTLNGGFCNTINGFWVSNHRYGIHVTSITYGTVISSVNETALSGAVYSIYAESGSIGLLLFPVLNTAASIPYGYWQQFSGDSAWISNPTVSGPVAMGGSKITGLANGTASTDAAAYGQTPAGGTTVTIGQGGTGQTGQQAAMDALAGATTSGDYLRGNGSHVVMAAIQAGDVPTLNQNTTGNAATATAAAGLKSATTTVAVSSATAPSSGQVLTATSSTAATWQPPSGSAAADPWLPGDDGLLAASWDPAANGGNAVVNNAEVYLIRIVPRTAMTVTNIVVGVNAAASAATSTGTYVGLYETNGSSLTLLSGSSDAGSAYHSATAGAPLAIPLTTPQAVAANTVLYAAILVNMSSAPTLYEASIDHSATNMGGSGTWQRTAAYGAFSVSSLPSSGTITLVGLDPLYPVSWWCGLS